MRLKDLREDHDLTQTAVAQKLHINQNTYSQYETGVIEWTAPILIKLARYYGVSTDYLLDLTDDPGKKIDGIKQERR